MNKILTLFSLMFSIPFMGISQGQITGFTVSPASPTTNDQVTVYVDLSFNSGGCDLDNKGSSTTGTTTTAYSLHCVGMLTVICTITDTFDLGYLSAGMNTFNFTLSSGFGGPGCSPGIVPDDTDSFQFTVQQGLGMDESAANHLVSVYPNPTNEFSILKINSSLSFVNTEIKIMDALGRVVKSIPVSSSETTISSTDISDGIYFYQVVQGEKTIAQGKWIVE